MRRNSAALNRAWLLIIGFVLLLAGVLGVITAIGSLGPLAAAAGISAAAPAGDQPVMPGADALANTGVVVIVAISGIVLFVLSVAWLIGQVPRTGSVKPFRLQDNPQTGITRIGADVLATAVENQIEALPGVHKADAIIRGSAAEPELTVRVSASDRTPLQSLIRNIQSQVARDLGIALDTELRHLGLQFDIDTGRRGADSITIG